MLALLEHNDVVDRFRYVTPLYAPDNALIAALIGIASVDVDTSLPDGMAILEAWVDGVRTDIVAFVDAA
jgi:hypothetical protein